MIDHPNVVKLVEVLANNTKIFIVLELINGGDLFDKIKETTKQQPPLSVSSGPGVSFTGKTEKVRSCGLNENLARDYFRQIMNAVDHCHQMGISHRDLKPENILIDENNTLKISDFGLSSFNPRTTFPNFSNTTCGTLSYISPEILKNEPYDAKMTDIWSCGVILYFMLVGKLPFDNRDMKRQLEKIVIAEYAYPSTVHGRPASKVSKHAKNLIAAILNPNPRKRLSIDSIFNSKWMHEADESDSDDEFIENTPFNQLNFSLRHINNKGHQQDELIPNNLIISQRNLLNQQSLQRKPNQQESVLSPKLMQKSMTKIQQTNSTQGKSPKNEKINKKINAFELISFCAGKKFNDIFQKQGSSSLINIFKKKDRSKSKDKKQFYEVNLQTEMPVISLNHQHLFSCNNPKKTFFKIITVIKTKLWRSHVILEDLSHPQLIMKVERDKGIIIRLQFVMKKLLHKFYMVQISHYQLEETKSKNAVRAVQTKQSFEEFSKICQTIVPILRRSLKVTHLDLIKDFDYNNGNNLIQRRLQQLEGQNTHKKRGVTPTPNSQLIIQDL
eukprot:403360509